MGYHEYRRYIAPEPYNDRIIFGRLQNLVAGGKDKIIFHFPGRWLKGKPGSKIISCPGQILLCPLLSGRITSVNNLPFKSGRSIFKFKNEVPRYYMASFQTEPVRFVTDLHGKAYGFGWPGGSLVYGG